jgi:hypothetical protein
MAVQVGKCLPCRLVIALGYSVAIKLEVFLESSDFLSLAVKSGLCLRSPSFVLL